MSDELPPGLRGSEMSWKAVTASHQKYEAQARAAINANFMMGRIPPPEYHEELLNVAQRLIQEAQPEKYQLAVVMAQAACDVFTEQIILALIDRVEPESLRKWIRQRVSRPNDLSEPRVRDLYLGLTGHKIDTGQGLWQEYVTHTDRRNLVVHRGAKVSKDEATHSHKVARKIIDYLRARRDGTGVPDEPTLSSVAHDTHSVGSAETFNDRWRSTSRGS